MPISIPAKLVDFILLGPFGDRRQLQDSPILGDVWAYFGAEPAGRLGLLISPYHGKSAAVVAKKINDSLPDDDARRLARVAFIHGYIAANLTFFEMLRHVAPLTSWWVNRFAENSSSKPVADVRSPTRLDRLLQFDVSRELTAVFQSAKDWHEKKNDAEMRETSSVRRFIALTGLLLWAADRPKPRSTNPDTQIRKLLEDPVRLADEVEAALTNCVDDLSVGEKGNFLVHSISRNRRAVFALERSVAAVKGDAARSLFSVRCNEIGWAVLDSGVDAGHPAFFDPATGKSRVLRSFDFTRYRDLDNFANATPAAIRSIAEGLVRDGRLKLKLTADEVEETLAEIVASAQKGTGKRWDLVERIVEIDGDLAPPQFSHGTHVAGIIGASTEGAKAWLNAEAESKKQKPNPSSYEGLTDGLCPDIRLYDFRVLAPNLEDTEFAIISALQFIRFLNQRETFMTIHGANLSLSIPHNVRNFACGQTPICEECNRLSENGVVVVAAAGNHGYKTFATDDGAFDSYAAFSITDPGNADDVITVGATHRFSPHTYGVSFFSSRGPTGDGRMKPDLVAPGEKIRAPLKDKQWGEQDGTSMAAPHVSGAAAMLMARYSEFRGRPRKIKQILCETATDLGRERTFQGRGMLDVLRAFQSI